MRSFKTAPLILLDLRSMSLGAGGFGLRIHPRSRKTPYLPVLQLVPEGNLFHWRLSSFSDAAGLRVHYPDEIPAAPEARSRADEHSPAAEHSHAEHYRAVELPEQHCAPVLRGRWRGNRSAAFHAPNSQAAARLCFPLHGFRTNGSAHHDLMDDSLTGDSRTTDCRTTDCQTTDCRNG